METLTGVELIAAERQRQIEVEGYTSDRDDAMSEAQIACAAACYALWYAGYDLDLTYWPWHIDTWKPKDGLSNLVRAGALIAAEIDRLQRVAEAAKED